MTDILDRAQQLIQAEKFEEANKELQRVAQSNSGNALVFQGIGYSLMRLGQYDDAIKAFHDSLRLDPTLVLPHAHLGHIYYLRHQYGESEVELQRAVELDPKLMEAKFNLALLISAQGRPEEGEVIIKQVLENKPDDSEAYCILSEIFIQQRRFNNGIEAARHAFLLSPSLSTSLRIVWAIVRKLIWGWGYP